MPRMDDGPIAAKDPFNIGFEDVRVGREIREHGRSEVGLGRWNMRSGMEDMGDLLVVNDAQLYLRAAHHGRTAGGMAQSRSSSQPSNDPSPCGFLALQLSLLTLRLLHFSLHHFGVLLLDRLPLFLWMSCRVGGQRCRRALTRWFLFGSIVDVGAWVGGSSVVRQAEDRRFMCWFASR